MAPSPERTAVSPQSSWPSVARFLAGFAACFWLWAKFLFSPRMVYLPPLPPVEIFFADIERALGPWPAVLFPTLALALIIWDGVAFRRKQGLHGWTHQMLRCTALSIAAHVALWVAGSLLFYILFSVLGGPTVPDPTGSTRGGLILFCAFFSLILSGPATLLAVSTAILWQRQRRAYPSRAMDSLNTVWSFLLAPLLALWILSGDPARSFHAFTRADQREIAKGLSAFIAAARDGEIAAVRSALESGTEPDARDPRDGTWALLVAADNGRAEIVETLIRAGANVNTRDNNGVTALMAAAKNGEKEIVQALIKTGADVNAKNNFGGSALMSAAARGHTEIVRALLAAGADPNAQDNRGGTALSAALAVNHAEIVRILHEAGVRGQARPPAH